MTPQLPPQLRAIMLPAEQILWIGHPDLIYIKRSEFWRRVGTFAVIFLVILVGLQLLVMQENPGLTFWDWGASGNNYPAVFGGLFFLVCLVVAWREKQKDEEFLQAQPPQIFYLLTHTRLLIYEAALFATASLPLANTEVNLRRQFKTVGDVLFYPAQGPLSKQQLRAKAFPVFAFYNLQNAADVYQRIIDAQNRLPANP